MGILANVTGKKQGVTGELDEIEAIFRVFSKIRRSGGKPVVLRKGRGGVQFVKFHMDCPDKWHFMDSMLFSLVTITTIGFGNQTPKTLKGKAFCVGYSKLASASLGL